MDFGFPWSEALFVCDPFCQMCIMPSPPTALLDVIIQAHSLMTDGVGPLVTKTKNNRTNQRPITSSAKHLVQPRLRRQDWIEGGFLTRIVELQCLKESHR